MISTLLFAFAFTQCHRLASADDLDLLLLHTNDMHSRFEQADIHGNICTDELAKSNQCYGGFARLKKAANDFKEEARKQNIPSLFLNAGDTFQGTPYYTMFKWKIAAALVSTLGFDVTSLGNHEFDDGVGDLTSFLKNITIPVVAANIDLSQEPQLQKVPNLTPSKVLEIDGKKVGIIGYILPATKYMSQTGNVTFLDEIEAIRKEAKRLKAENVNIIIGLGHSGFEKDIEIARQVPEISLIVGGHTHSLLYTPKEKPPSIDHAIAEYPFIVTQKSGRKVPIVQAYCHTKYLGKLRVKFDDQGNVITTSGNNILLDSSFQEDATVLQDLLPYKTIIEKLISKVLGKTNVFLSRIPTKDTPESNFGNMVADAYVNYVTRKYDGPSGWTDGALGLLQIGTMKTNIDNKKAEGKITYGDLLTTMPHDNMLVKAKISGAALHRALEYSMEEIIVRESQFYILHYLYLSGIKVVYDASRPAGQRITSLSVRCANCSIPKFQKFCPHHVYTIVTSDYIFNGGDGFNMFKDHSEAFESMGISCTNVVADYLQMQEVVYPGIEERILINNIQSSSIAIQAGLICPILSLLVLLYS